MHEYGAPITPAHIAWLGGYVNWCTLNNLDPIEFFEHLKHVASSLKNNMQKLGCMATGAVIGGTAVYYGDAIKQRASLCITPSGFACIGRTIAQSNKLEELSELPASLNLKPTHKVPLKIVLHAALSVGSHHALSSEFLRKKSPDETENDLNATSFFQSIFSSDPMLEKIQNPKQFVYENPTQVTTKDHLYLITRSVIHQSKKPMMNYITGKIHEKELNKEFKIGTFVILTTDDIADVAITGTTELLSYECMRNLSANIQKDGTDTTKLPALKAATAAYLFTHNIASKASENIILQAYQQYARPKLSVSLAPGADMLAKEAAPFVASACATHCFNLAKYLGTLAVTNISSMRSS